MTKEQLAAITDSDFGLILNEFRNRGYAVAAYGVAELGEGPLQDEMGDYDAEKVGAFLQEHRDGLEEALSKGVWDYCENADSIYHDHD